MSEYGRYIHHGSMVWVREDLKGKHRDYCLCHSCKKFKPIDQEHHCKTADLLYRLCILADLVTPVWECPQFEQI